MPAVSEWTCRLTLKRLSGSCEAQYKLRTVDHGRPAHVKMQKVPRMRLGRYILLRSSASRLRNVIGVLAVFASILVCTRECEVLVQVNEVLREVIHGAQGTSERIGEIRVTGEIPKAVTQLHHIRFKVMSLILLWLSVQKPIIESRYESQQSRKRYYTQELIIAWQLAIWLWRIRAMKAVYAELWLINSVQNSRG